jgi:hypothetical protein
LAFGPPTRRVSAVLTAVEPEPEALVVRYAPERGVAPEIEDRLRLGPPGDVAAIYGVGRWLRILRAGRVHVADDPYVICRDPLRALELLRRCIGAVLVLSVARRMERSLTLWTDQGVERIDAVLDFVESTDGLTVRRRGGGPLMHIARESLIRWESGARERLEVVSVDAPSRVRASR